SLTLFGSALGLLLLYGLMLVAQPLIETQLGMFIPIGWPSVYELKLLLAVFIAGVVVSILPAYRAYRYSLADGMSIRI
ncbi:MAG: ABC transporter permease, partial [Gammaproteobacteria bacterium]|nr:ABC transporter permease [Gammaproteobacteria bacterium]